MRRFYLVGFALLLAFDTLAQISFKYAGSYALPLHADAAWVWRVLTQPWSFAAIAGYVGAFFTWMTVLKHAPIGPAFAASHLETVTVVVLSVPLFGERIGPTQALGGLMIVAGIICLALATEQAPAERPCRA